MRTRVRKAFTLVEILIVVVILGILAAIVVPQFTRATQEAQSGNIRSQLDVLNNQIELWRARHNGFVPPYTNTTQTTSMAGYDWSDMITPVAADPNSGGYVKSAPRNPINNQTSIGDTLAAGQGWTWMEDPANPGVWKLFACEFNNTTGEAMPGQAGLP
jgi:general secretion pathway protein G